MKALYKAIVYLVVMVFFSSTARPIAFAAESDDVVSDVIQQLEAIDTLQEMQNKRKEYTASGHYDVNTTNEDVINRHEAARSGYETYVDTMFAARIAAKNAYDALTEEQKAQIDPALAAKLDDHLPTVFHGGTFAVTPDEEYTFEAVNGGAGYAYEVSNHMVSGNIPQTFILVDTSDGKTSWTPDGRYEYGKSNYEVAYCCDVETPLEYGSDYRRLNLEDSHYYSKAAAEHIRAIVMNAYPFVTMDEMKEQLKDGGLDADFVDSLTRADMIAAVQQAIWAFANSDELDSTGYFASVDIPSNRGIYFTELHDYTNECWDWLPGKRTRSFDREAAYRVNNLAYYLCNLEGTPAAYDAIVISSVDITRASLIPGTDDLYELGIYVRLNNGASSRDNLTVSAASFDAEGNVTGKTAQTVYERDVYELSLSVRPGDTVTVKVEGTQYVGKGVYFYEPEGGRETSQSLVGISEGATRVNVEKTFSFNQDIEKGIRIYKTEKDTGRPLSGITFDVYEVVLDEGESISEMPTIGEVERYADEKNKVGSLTTDSTGYASLALEEGIYLVIEEFDEDKVKEPAVPFYIRIPMPVEHTEIAGETSAVYLDIVSVYPKNVPVTPPDTPPVNPPPMDNVNGSFTIIKHAAADEEKLLSGAEFQVFRAAAADDKDMQFVECGGIEYAVSPVMVNGEKLILTTDENGSAVSPKLNCGTYFLLETKAPKGYRIPGEAVIVTVKSDLVSAAEEVRIANTAGNILPETGGTGKKLMIIIGSILSIGAAVFLVTKKRMSRYE